MKKILIIEDDFNLGTSLQTFLEEENYQISWIKCLEDYSSNLSKNDLIILDWRLPDGQGIDLLKSIRKQDINTPIIMLSAKSDLLDKVMGLESGANDYITKPFEPRELLARIRVHLKNIPIEKHKSINMICVNNLEINCSSRTVSCLGKNIEFTKLEYELLLLLTSEPNRVFSRNEILNKVWGYENFPTTRTVDTHILQLRQKLSDDYFETIRGVGYCFKLTKN